MFAYYYQLLLLLLFPTLFHGKALLFLLLCCVVFGKSFLQISSPQLDLYNISPAPLRRQVFTTIVSP